MRGPGEQGGRRGRRRRLPTSSTRRGPVRRSGRSPCRLPRGAVQHPGLPLIPRRGADGAVVPVPRGTWDRTGALPAVSVAPPTGTWSGSRRDGRGAPRRRGWVGGKGPDRGRGRGCTAPAAGSAFVRGGKNPGCDVPRGTEPGALGAGGSSPTGGHPARSTWNLPGGGRSLGTGHQIRLACPGSVPWAPSATFHVEHLQGGGDRCVDDRPGTTGSARAGREARPPRSPDDPLGDVPRGTGAPAGRSGRRPTARGRRMVPRGTLGSLTLGSGDGSMGG